MLEKKLNYATYLQLDSLLNSQKLESDNEHDEMLFIIIHQSYELWFKQILHELFELYNSFSSNNSSNIVSTLKRIRSILKVLTSQFDVLETMSPFSFNSFRKYLGTASGFQSMQFRELEIVLGIKKIEPQNSHVSSHKALYNKYKNNSIWLAFLDFIKTNVQPEINKVPPSETDSTKLVLLHIYKNHSIYTEIAELLLDVDEGLQEWRYRHLKLVERTIGLGTKGTGGSAGFDYLKSTIYLSFCPDLWEIRNYFYEQSD